MSNTVADWEQRFLNAWNDGYQALLDRSTSGDSYMHYGLSYGIDGLQAMARATSDVNYMHDALDLCMNVISTAQVSSSLPDSQFQDGYMAWPTTRSGREGEEIPLDESVFWRYVTLMLRHIRDRSSWYNQPDIRSKYDDLLHYAEIEIFEKWDTRGPWDYIYRSRTHMASHWAKIALHLSWLTTNSTRKARYDKVRNRINLGPVGRYDSSLRDQMIAHPQNPNAYFWDSVWESYATPGSDVAHGNHVLDYLIEAQNYGNEWTMTDIDKMVVLFDTIIWPSANNFTEYVDGSGTGNGYIGGWCKLGRHDSALQARLEGHTVSNTRWAIQTYGNGALNAHRLGL